MDEETLIRLEAEIREVHAVDGVNEDLDETDGFIQLVKKQLDKISGKCDQKSSDASSTASGSSSREDFQEAKTSLVAGETKHRGQGDSGDIYNFKHADRGLAVVINNEDFTGEYGPRPGSSYDAAALYRTLKKLGFKVMVKTNLTGMQMVNLLKLVKDSYDHKNADCFVCCILTHGNEGLYKRASERMGDTSRHDLLIGSDGEPVFTRNVVDIFSDKNCEGLQGKPRLFFLQACRGSKYDDGVDIITCSPARTQGCFGVKGPDKTDSRSSPVDQTDSRAYKRQTSSSSSVDPPEYHQRLADSTDAKPSSSAEEKKEKGKGDSNPSSKTPGALGAIKSELQETPLRDVPFCPTPLYKDCLIMYATPPGYYAWRRKNGAWFIQSLCDVLNSPQIGTVSLLNALVEVSRNVAFNYQSENPSRLDMHQKKEIPVIESMLVKDVYLV